MSKTNRKTRFFLILLATVLAISFVLLPFRGQEEVDALTETQIRQQINQLQKKITDNSTKAKELQQQADSLKTKLAELDIQISQMDAQIRLTDLRIAELQDKLEKTQAELERQKGLLKASMRTLYKKRGASTVELLAASESFSKFIDEQEYLERLKASIQDSAEKVVELKAQLEDQQFQQQQLREAQKGQRQALATKKEEQRLILEKTQGQADKYASVAEELRKQQAALNAQLAVTGDIDFTLTTSYPWAGYEPWSFDGCYADPWGMCVRQCVSYTAWKVAQSGRKMPHWGGHGNANQWDDNARVDGIPVDSYPRVGDVAVSNNGFYGHVMYVEAILPDGRIRVSQYNIKLQGEYSEMTIWPAGLVFIHF